jgi:hypothetical protein
MRTPKGSQQLIMSVREDVADKGKRRVHKMSDRCRNNRSLRVPMHWQSDAVPRPDLDAFWTLPASVGQLELRNDVAKPPSSSIDREACSDFPVSTVEGPSVASSTPLPALRHALQDPGRRGCWLPLLTPGRLAFVMAATGDAPVEGRMSDGWPAVHENSSTHEIRYHFA